LKSCGFRTGGRERERARESSREGEREGRERAIEREREKESEKCLVVMRGGGVGWGEGSRFGAWGVFVWRWVQGYIAHK